MRLMGPDRRAKHKLVEIRLAHSNILAILLQEGGKKLLRFRENMHRQRVNFAESYILK